MKKKILYPLVIMTLLVGMLAGGIMTGVSAADPPPSSVPATINYQGTLHGQQGKLSGNYTMTFAIYTTQSALTPLWSETQSVVVSNGAFNVLLGSVNATLPAALDTGKFLGIKVGADSEMTPRQPLASVPYALRSEHSNRANSVVDRAIGKDQLKEKVIGKGQLEDKVVGKGQMEDKVVGKGQMEDKVVGKGQMEDKVVGKGQLEDKVVGKGQMEDKVVGKGQLEDKVIGKGQMENKAVGKDQLEDKAVGKQQIADRSIGRDQLDEGVLLNPLQIATLRWYEAIQTSGNFSVGDAPVAIAFDGAHIWVANRGNKSLTKLRPSDGSIVGTYPVVNPFPAPPTALIPTALGFDGTNIWVKTEEGVVVILKASDGSLVNYWGGSSGLSALAFDGASMWVVGGGGFGTGLRKMTLSAGSIYVDDMGAGFGTGAMAFDGTNMWWAISDTAVAKINTSNGSIAGPYTANHGGGSPITVMAFDGANIWVPNTGNNSVTKLRASDGSMVGSYGLGGPFGFGLDAFGPKGIVFDGTNIWVANESNTVTKLRARDGSLVGVFPAGDTHSFFPNIGMAFDGANIWIVNTDTDTVTKR